MDLLSTITDKTHVKNISFPSAEKEAIVVIITEATAPIVIIQEVFYIEYTRLVFRSHGDWLVIAQC